MWSIHIQAEIEKRGIPAVSIITTPFIRDAKCSAELFGVPCLRSVVLPHPIGHIPEESLIAKMEAAYNDFILALTDPLTTVEATPGVRKTPPRDRIFFRGNPEQAYPKYVSLGLTDGLPIVLPTEEKVEEMLKGTSHARDEIIGQMPPEKLEVTVEKVAINGVMAGCRPEYMPVLLATAEALIEPACATLFVRSTTSFAFWSMVNGPIADEIGMNYGINALGPGNTANATIGRAIRLFLINLGGVKPGENDMGSLGNALKYGFSFAENEKASPWPPFHVSQGFKAEDSTVTVFQSWGFRSTSFTSPGGDLDLANIAYTAQNTNAGHGVLARGIVILMDPLLAKQIAEKGLSKEDVKMYLFQSIQWSVRDWKNSAGGLLISDPSSNPVWYNYLAPDVMIPKFKSPDCFELIVVGGQTNPFYQIFEGVNPAQGTIKSVDKWR